MNYKPEQLNQLIYSAQPANDQLVFEIIKNNALVEKLLPELLAIATTLNAMSGEEKVDFKLEIGETLKPFVTKEQLNKLLTYDQLYSFSNDVLAKVNYIRLKRLPHDIRYSVDFLNHSTQHHPHRQEIVQLYSQQLLNAKYYSIDIPALYDDELNEVFQPIHKNIHQGYLHINCSRLQQPDQSLLHFSVDLLRLTHLTEEQLALFQTIQCKKLDVRANKINLNHLQLFQTIEHCRLSTTELQSITSFDFLEHLPQLQELFIDGNLVIEQHKTLLRPRKLPIINNKLRFRLDKTLDSKQWLSLAAAIGKSVLTQEEQYYYFKQLIENKQNFTVNDCLALMNVSHADLRNSISQRIEELSIQRKPSSKAVIYITGTTIRKKAEIKEELTALGFNIVTRFNKNITHVIIGKNPKNYQQLVELNNLKIISEQWVNTVINEQNEGFLQQASKTGETQLIDNTLELLQSNDISSVNVALELLNSGGVPPSTIEPLILLQKTATDASVRKTVKTLLLKNAPKQWHSIINDRQIFTNILTAKAQEINKKLEKVAQKTSPEDAVELSLLLHKHLGKGLRYIFYHYKSQSEIRNKALKATMEGTHFNFSQALGFKNWKNTDFENTSFFSMAQVVKFPVDAVKTIPLIESANFHNCKFKTIPAQIKVFKDIKELDLSYNFLSDLPKSFAELKQLKTLDIRANYFTKFPEVLFQLQGLEQLMVANNYDKNDRTIALTITDEIREKMPNCTIVD